jgi:hypothetical protein
MASLNTKMQRIVIALVAAVMFIALGYYELDRASKQMLESKTAHEATATVQRKEHIAFDERNRSYISDDGIRFEVKPGTEQWRVYYQLDRFDQLANPRRTLAIQAEKERNNKFGLRFTYNSKEWYDKIEAGDKLLVTYQAFSDGAVKVISVINPQYPSLH